VPRTAHPTHRFILLAAVACLVSTAALAQSSDSQSPANQSSISATDLNSNNANPTRSTETHTQSGNRTLDTHTLQRQGSDGQFEPYQDIETEIVKVNSTTVRTTTRTFGRDADGNKTLMQVREEEKRTLPGGDSNVTRVVSAPDADRRLQPVQREIEQTRKIGDNLEQTKRTVLLPSVNGDLTPAMQIEERRVQGANDTVQIQTTTSLPDGEGNWQVNETKHTTTQKDGKNSSTEERVSRLNPDGKLEEISHTVTHESESATGEKSGATETYSVDVPGTPRDGDLHLIQRTTTSQRTSSSGQQTTQHQVEQPDPADPSAGVRVTLRTTNTVRPASAGTRSTQTIQALDPNGDLSVVSVDTTKSDGTAVQVQIAPPEKKN
jgi:hypothetical protein